MSQDRSDVQYCVKELSRKMARPSSSDMQKLKRLARYLVGKERHELVYRYQALDWVATDGKQVLNVKVDTDTDFAGCKETRKSTSGGVIRLGRHAMKTWSTTQSVVALSSGEAEYYGLVKGGAQGIGIKAMLEDLAVPVDVTVTVRSDASAAVGIAHRSGVGRVRHIEVAQLWLQRKVRDKVVKIDKISTHVNLADALTKPSSKELLERHIVGTGQRHATGRHKLMPEVAKDKGE